MNPHQPHQKKLKWIWIGIARKTPKGIAWKSEWEKKTKNFVIASQHENLNDFKGKEKEGIGMERGEQVQE